MPNLNTIIKNVCLTLFILYFNKNLRNFGNAVWAIFPTRSGNEMNIEKKSLNSSMSISLFSIIEQNLKPRRKNLSSPFQKPTLAYQIAVVLSLPILD